MLNLVKFSFGISPSRLGILKDRGEPTFFLVAIKFLFRFNLIYLEETTLLVKEGVILDYC